MEGDFLLLNLPSMAGRPLEILSFQPASGVGSASNHLLPVPVKMKSMPGMLMVSQELSGACPNKVISCPYRKVALEEAGGLLAQHPQGGGR